jgi:ABC-type polysaccharide/polyol phosphate export permease
MEKALSDLVRGAKLYNVWLYQAYFELSAKYRRTIFGSLWISSQMVFTSLAVAVLWGSIFGKDFHEHLPRMMSGNLIGITALFLFYDANEIFNSSGGIIKNHAYPFTYFVFERVAQKIMLFFHNLVVFYIFMFIFGTAVVPNPVIVLGLITLTLNMFLWGTLIGMLSARYRDLRFLLPNVGHLLFFITPIYWNYDMLKTNHWIADFNPLFAFVNIVREPLLGHLPTAHNWMMAGGCTALGAVLWIVFFSAFRRRIPFWV